MDGSPVSHSTAAKNTPRAVKRVAAVHDLSAFGRCALTVVIPVLSALGIQVIPLPTALMSTHTGGYERRDIYYRDLSDTMEPMYSHWASLGVTFDAIYSGFIISPEQGEIIRRFAEIFASSETLFLCDPAFGDDGRLYSACTGETVSSLRALSSFSQITTPNITEACMLTGTPLADTRMMAPDELSGFCDMLLEKLCSSGPSRVVITGIPVRAASGADMISTAGMDRSDSSIDQSPFYITLPRIGGSYPGTGELFTSVMLGKILRGADFHAAVAAASAFTRDTIDITAAAGTTAREGVLLEPMLYRLTEY